MLANKDLPVVPISINRRQFVVSASALAMSLEASAIAAPARHQALARVIIDNDYADDPDGLFQLAHHLLCPSVKIPLISSSHLPVKFGASTSASGGSTKARDLLKVMKLADRYIPIAGSEVPVQSRALWKPVPTTAAIVREAMRDDTGEPLIYAAGAA